MSDPYAQFGPPVDRYAEFGQPLTPDTFMAAQAPTMIPDSFMASRWLVQAPDGKVIQFPDEFTEDDVNREMMKLCAPNGSVPSSIDSAVASRPKPPNPILKASQMDTDTLGTMYSDARTAGQAGTDITKGVGEGALNTLTGLSPLINKIPYVGETLAPSQGIAAAQKLSTPTNTTQKVARGAEQVGEFLLPTGAEEKAATLLPKAPLIPKLVAGALETGVRNKLQGGDFVTGAAAGASGTLLGAGLQAVAPKIAETALGVTPKLRRPGRAIGQAVLDETTGLSPSKIAASTQDVLTGLNQQLETAAANSPHVASTQPALQVILNEAQKAAEKNSGQTLEKLNQVWDQLTKEYGTSNPIPSDLPASRILQLKRGVDDLVKNWQPAERQGFDPILKQVRGALDAELDRTVPEAAELNQRMSSLIPAKQRAVIESSKAPFVQRVLGRTKAHTGALVGAAVGGSAGYREGGTPGALVGGVAGLVTPEIIAEPSVEMALARLAQKGGTISRVARGTGLQADRTLGQQAADYVQQKMPNYFPPESDAEKVAIQKRLRQKYKF
jgi:hypothetical protein